MSTDLVVSVSEIRAIFGAALDALEANGVTEVTLDKDVYWKFFSEHAFQFEQQPEPVVGSLYDDIEDLRRDMESLKNDEGASLWHMLHHLDGLVKMLGEASRLRGL